MVKNSATHCCLAMDISPMLQLHLNYVVAIAHIYTLHTSDEVLTLCMYFYASRSPELWQTFAETSRTAFTFTLRCFVIHLTYCKCICCYNNNNKFHATH